MTHHSITKTQDRYVEYGEGDAIILLYGLFGSVKNFGPLIQHLRQTYRVIVPIFPFYELGTTISIFTLTEFLHEVTEEMGLQKFHLLGNSMGGHIALLYALKHPHKIESLILSGSSGLYETGMGDSFPKRKDYTYIRKKAELTFFDPAIASTELVDEIYETVNSLRVIQILSLAKSTIHNNLCKELSKISVNCCLIWGRNDLITPPAVALEFKRLIPHSTLSWVDQCGHVPMLERPKIFNTLLDLFLESLHEKTM